MKIKISQIINPDSQERIVCGILDYQSSDDQPKILFLDEESIFTKNNKMLFLSSTFEIASENISIFIREEETHIFTGIFNLTYVGTYFAFITLDGTFTELFFEK